MFRRLTASDHDRVVAYLSKRPALHTFLTGDIERYGYDAPFQEVYGYLSDGCVTAVLLRFYGSYIFSTEGPDAVEEVVRVLQSNTAWSMIQGDSVSLSLLQDVGGFQPRQVREFAFAERPPHAPRPFVDTSVVRQATVDHVGQLWQLRKSIAEFANSQTTELSLRQSFEAGDTLCFYVPGERGEMAASASVVAENTWTAMVVGVCTRPLYRGLGYATRCVAKLCDVFDERGKTLCLYYDNPNAGGIYRRLGFAVTSGWTQFFR
ncbi:GNAT family N-acetyltransferase [Alicyclobacillus fructus]|uniref:GNAT family N-acetyltransferase n=1 Tax=Alicyclobacillus fructus TaxID=2816082 RepID=UPI001A8D592D|nr:GNAT family N-acetyltransferase [Alicyclobacillus fructus]